HVFDMSRGDRPALPVEIFCYALLDYWEGIASSHTTLSFERVYMGGGSPGSTFRLSEDSLAERLESLPEWTGLRFDETAGMRQLIKVVDKGVSPMSALSEYYSGV